MQIKVYENSLRARKLEQMLMRSRLAMRFSEIIVLPIPTTRDGIHVSGSELNLMDAVCYADPDTLVIGYGVPEEICSVLSSFGASVCDVARDEGFLAANAELTAVAALGALLGSERRAPCDMTIGIAGLGRIGSALMNKLLYLGARVKIYTTREGLRRELAEAGVESEELPILSPAALCGLDVLINTAPARVFSRAVRDEDIPPLRIMDLATGAEFPDAAAVERYPALPARCFPESAGRAWAESVDRLLLLGGASEVGDEL